MVRSILLFVTMTLFAVATGQADTTVLTYRCPDTADCPSDDDAGRLIESELRYNLDHDDFTWLATYEPVNGELPCALWLVIGRGPDPETTSEQFAILYADIASGRATAYVYDKDAGENSWQNPGVFIRTFPNAVASSMVGGNLEFTLYVNTTTINGFPGPDDWVGLFFADTVGIWIAALSGCDVSFDAEGRLTQFAWDKRSSYDRNDRTTVPPLSVDESSWGRVKVLYR